jgi:hypothetical protein
MKKSPKKASHNPKYTPSIIGKTSLKMIYDNHNQQNKNIGKMFNKKARKSNKIQKD